MSTELIDIFLAVNKASTGICEVISRLQTRHQDTRLNVYPEEHPFHNTTWCLPGELAVRLLLPAVTDALRR